MSCPLCGSAVVYQGLSAIECEGWGCANGLPSVWEVKTWSTGYFGRGAIKLWVHPTGARVGAYDRPNAYYSYYRPKTDLLSPDGLASTLEEAQRLALGGKP